MRAVMDTSLPSGLTNLGNTCFANATTLQTILHIPFLQEYINKHEECSKNCYCQYHNNINVHLATLFCICLIKRLKNLCMQEKAKVIQPTEIYNHLNRTVMHKTNMKQITYFIKFIAHWSPVDQEDANEFVIQVIPQIEESYL